MLKATPTTLSPTRAGPPLLPGLISGNLDSLLPAEDPPSNRSRLPAAQTLQFTKPVYHYILMFYRNYDNYFHNLLWEGVPI
jgi:hypothetical protein